MARIAIHIRALVLIGLLSFGVSNSAAQVVGQVATGTPAFNSFGGGAFDTVNLGNLNTHFAIPILHKAGRGVPFYYDLTYDSSIWTAVTSNGVTQWQPTSYWGWNVSTAALSGYVTYTALTQSEPCSGSKTTYSHWAFHDRFGRVHPFSGSTYYQNIPCNKPPDTWGAPVTGQSYDGSGFSISASSDPSWTITSASGQVFNNLPGNSQSGTTTVTDANGNKLSSASGTQFFDTLSGATPVLTVSGSGTPASPTKFSYT